MSPNCRRSRGFSLIEVLLVVTVILILCAIVIPNYFTVQQETNGTAAVDNLRTLDDALNSYATQYTSIGYPPDLTELGPPASGASASSSAADLVDAALAAAATTEKQGYLFTYTPGTDSPSTSFTISAAPQSTAIGLRYFYMDQDGVITYNDGAVASASSSVLGQ